MDCTLFHDGCTRAATTLFLVHGCAEYRACASCAEKMHCTVIRSFAKFSKMTCKRCGKRFTLPEYMDSIDMTDLWSGEVEV